MNCRDVLELDYVYLCATTVTISEISVNHITVENFTFKNTALQKYIKNRDLPVLPEKSHLFNFKYYLTSINKKY
jgi:hypothetical protein